MQPLIPTAGGFYDTGNKPPKDLKGARVSFLNYILRILFIAKQPPG